MPSDADQMVFLEIAFRINQRYISKNKKKNHFFFKKQKKIFFSGSAEYLDDFDKNIFGF